MIPATFLVLSTVGPVFQTEPELPDAGDASREIVAEKPYLNLPVKHEAPRRRMQLIVEGRVERDFGIPLADADPDYWVFMDLLPFRGQRLTLRVEGLPQNSGALAAIEQGDTIKGAEDLYREPLRPQVHFTSRRGWLNDPNGLVYHAGEWHLFYQHNPYSTQWDNMHWGHAVSPDLVHWQELPVALYPDQHGTCFSGSAVVDHRNTAGFQTGTEPALVCIYTAAGSPFTQCLAVSLDRGRTWTKPPVNPVLGHIVGENRDPRVIWYEPARKWVMALYLDGNDFGLFSSPDLIRWEWLSTVTIPGTSECPEFFPIPVEGREGESRWIFYGGSGHYLVGSFDGATFTPESGPHPLSWGNCFYASQTFNGAPDGRRIQIAWGRVGMPGMPFNQMMDFPVELTLRETEEGLRLFANPVRELGLLHDGPGYEKTSLSLNSEEFTLPEVRAEVLHVQAEFELEGAAAAGLVLRGIPITYDVQSQQLACQGCVAPLKPDNGRLRLEAIVDRTSIEVFANDGRVYMPVGAYPPPDNLSVGAFARGGAVVVRRLQVWPLRSIWHPVRDVPGGG